MKHSESDRSFPSLGVLGVLAVRKKRRCVTRSLTHPTKFLLG
ncbi:hypothetical protein [Scytonema sp. PCC 10023]